MTPAAIKADIDYDDLCKIDIRVGTITQVLEVAKSDKLMKLIVDFGDHQRSILAGIKQERANPRAHYCAPGFCGKYSLSQVWFSVNITTAILLCFAVKTARPFCR